MNGAEAEDPCPQVAWQINIGTWEEAAGWTPGRDLRLMSVPHSLPGLILVPKVPERVKLPLISLCLGSPIF